MHRHFTFISTLSYDDKFILLSVFSAIDPQKYLSMYFSWSNAFIVRWRRRCRTPFECRQTSSPWSRSCRISRKPRSIDRSLRRKRTQLRFQQHRPRRKTIRSRWTPASSSNTPRWRKLSPLVSLGRFRPCRPMVWDLVFRKSSLKRDCAAIVSCEIEKWLSRVYRRKRVLIHIQYHRDFKFSHWYLEFPNGPEWVK